ncbi:MAG TPA: HAMP domain-containing sensor histidine kinase, partial [Candidatus Pacearchaeota archaeon]|nr:HAMP domain-containing sensor histidine kinase [Candidatus Pacearchaeota archaeon]
IPLALYFYVLLTVQSFENAAMNEIEAHDFTASDALLAMVERDFPAKDTANLEALQKTIDRIVANDTRLKNIRVIVKDGRDYKAVAAQNRDQVGMSIDVTPSLNGESLIAYSWVNASEDVSSEIEIAGEKLRRVIKVFVGEDGEVYALAAADFSINRTLDMIAAGVYQSYLIMGVIMILSLFLIVQHARLFSYVGLSKDLQQKNTAKDNFIRMATHELRAPVTVLTGYTDLLKEDLAGTVDADQQKYIDRMVLSVKNLSDLMADILEVSHLEQGRTDFEPEIIAPDIVVKEIVDGLAAKAEQKGLKLSFDAKGFSHKIRVNPVCFKRIVTNLVENSIKYTPAGKVAVTVAAQTAKKRCAITIQDTGFGISAEGQAHLFEQFYRVKTQENAEIPGTGLGLWMSREMARKMGGDIMLESIEKMGSKFFIFFPLAK